MLHNQKISSNSDRRKFYFSVNSNIEFDEFVYTICTLFPSKPFRLRVSVNNVQYSNNGW